MSESAIGRLGTSWFANHVSPEHDSQDMKDMRGAHQPNANGDPANAAATNGADSSKPNDANGPNPANSAHPSGPPAGAGNPSRDSVNPHSANDGTPNPSGSNPSSNAALGNRSNGDARSPQGTQQPGGSDGTSNFGKYDGKNLGWGNGDGGGQNKGVRLDNPNGSSMSGDGLLSDVGHALDTLLGRNSSYTASSLFESTNSSSQAILYADSSRSSSHFDAPGNDVAHDIGEAAASLLDGRSGNRVDPSNLSNRSFNDWANTKADAQGPRNPSSASPASEQTNAAPSRTATNVAAEEEPAARFSGADEETTMAFRASDRPAANLSARGAGDFEEAALARGNAAEDGLFGRAGRNDGANPSTTADAAKQAAGQTQEDGPDALLAQNRAAQTPANATRADDDAQDAATLRQALAARAFDTATTRAPNATDADARQAAKDAAQQQTQNASYVGEGKQAVPDANKTLIGSVQKVEAVAANVNAEQDEMKQTPHLDTQQMLMRQFAPALVGISALISSALGGTTMLVSPGGSAAPLLLGVSALLFGMGAWRSGGAVRAQLAQEKSWAQMLGDPGARQSLLAAGANSLGLAGSVGLSLLAIV